MALHEKKENKGRILTHDTLLTKLAGIFPSTFLQLVNGCKNSILN